MAKALPKTTTQTRPNPGTTDLPPPIWEITGCRHCPDTPPPAGTSHPGLARPGSASHASVGTEIGAIPPSTTPPGAVTKGPCQKKKRKKSERNYVLWSRGGTTVNDNWLCTCSVHAGVARTDKPNTAAISL
ncbi:hypothetical protein AAFF_G00063930 [Aldrovandia affinis]|uniref:Uncharacterized protein n=1 Tax=Aldrovandia affinis TaxID=143900 RepID=A0AAD7T3L4_9TELE|nr:hypothetical protein AAFF_G00063930 [Aldrovandia affinis]